MHGWLLPISLPSSIVRARPSLVPPSPVPFLPAADASLIDRTPIRSDTTILATGFVVVQKRRPMILSIGAASGRKINDAICYRGAACQRESLYGLMGRDDDAPKTIPSSAEDRFV